MTTGRINQVALANDHLRPRHGRGREDSNKTEGKARRSHDPSDPKDGLRALTTETGKETKVLPDKGETTA